MAIDTKTGIVYNDEDEATHDVKAVLDAHTIPTGKAKLQDGTLVDLPAKVK